MEGDRRLSTEEVSAAFEAVMDRVDATLTATGERFPLYADPDTGRWETTPNGNWCGGHWVGLLWLAFDHADAPAEQERYDRAARSHTATVREAIPETTMFCGMARYYTGFRGYDATGDRELFGLGLAGADAMATLFHETARQVPSGTFDIEGGSSFSGSADPDHRFTTAAVDNVYTALPVCWRAARETGDRRFRDLAISHADRHLDWFLRADGSTLHHVRFDGETGRPTTEDNELAAGPETCWARGLGWNIAGLSRAFRETGAGRYLNALERSVAYYRDHVPEDLVPFWDLEAPGIPAEPRDTSGAALVAYGLTRLPAASTRSPRIAGFVDRIESLREIGHAVLGSLVRNYLVTDHGDRRGMILHGCYDGPGEYATDNELIWTDYYVAYALAAAIDRPAATRR